MEYHVKSKKKERTVKNQGQYFLVMFSLDYFLAYIYRGINKNTVV
jgi:hypothetical protein